MISATCPNCNKMDIYPDQDRDTYYLCTCGYHFKNPYPKETISNLKESPGSSDAAQPICKACDTKIVIRDCLGNVAQQPHYTQWKIQPITFITANKLNFCQGNVIKYVMRYNQKNGLEDLKKAKVYIGYLIQELETGEVKP